MQNPQVKRRRMSRIQSQIALQSYANTINSPANRKIRARRQIATQIVPPATIGQTIAPRPVLLEYVPACPHCHAFKYQYESENFCCGGGTIKLAQTTLPPELLRLYTSNDEDAKHFRLYSRLYNNLFAFSSIGGDIKGSTRNGIHVVRVHGQIYHNVPDLVPKDGSADYLQLYFYDGEHEGANRAGKFDKLREDVINTLIKVTEHNPYAQFFRSLRELEIDDETQILINKTSVPDQRTYNAPTSNEVAAIWTEKSSSSSSGGPYIIVRGKSNESHRIMHYYGCYDPLQYPFICADGQCGWHRGILKLPRPMKVKKKKKKNRQQTSAFQMHDNTDIAESESETDINFEHIYGPSASTDCWSIHPDSNTDFGASTSAACEVEDVVADDSDFEDLFVSHSSTSCDSSDEDNLPGAEAEVISAPIISTEEEVYNEVEHDPIESVEQLLATEEARVATDTSNPDENTKTVSCREYYAYKLQHRPQNMLLRAGRCFQQYVVDMYIKVENTRLDFFRRNQETIRADLYQGLVDTVALGEWSAVNAGRRVILPATYIGEPRDMHRRYLNAMALVQKFGKPDLFITMTCNANWPEIKCNLERGEVAQNRPELVTRVFRAKLLALKKQIKQGKIFGEVAALIYVVEFQKRGLPHAHFIVILKPGYKLKCPEDFDKFVAAEILPKASPYLRSTILRHMMHGPCGDLNPSCQCMNHDKSRGHCKYRYPKDFCPATSTNQDGYPLYRRRDNGDVETVHNCQLNNQWVIPYNPYLYAMFDCHMNVEICSTIQAVKYLYKYVYKGHDKVSFALSSSKKNKPINEIDQYQSGRWVSPCEAAWRLFGFDLFDMYPAVIPLQVHLPNMQQVRIRPFENLANIVGNEQRVRTALTEFFAVNKENGGCGYTYNNFPEHYRWHPTKRRWLKRKNKVMVIGRLTFVNPAEGERYFLRLLLANVRSPTCFDGLLVVDGVKCATFQEAAVKRCLVEEDGTAQKCLQEAAEVQMPAALRKLFATILVFCHPSNPKALWIQFFEELSSDFQKLHQQNPAWVQQLTISEIEKQLDSMGHTLKTYGLQDLLIQEDEHLRRTRDITDALDAPIPKDCIACRHNLNFGQQTTFDAIVKHIKSGKSGAFFIDGPGGTGKTYLYKALYAEFWLMQKIVLPTATSGIAASNIPSGRTAHSRFKIPIDRDSSQSCNVPKQSSLAALIKASSLIIWDEASMAKKADIEAVNTLLRDLCNPNLIFGGKVVVFGGDFRQVLPVIPRKSVGEIEEASLVFSHLWPQLKKYRLQENIRAIEDPQYSSFLLELGNGELQDTEVSSVQLPGQLFHPLNNDTDHIHQVIDIVFPQIRNAKDIAHEFNTTAILTPMNEDVDLLNAVLIEQFPGEPTTYKSYDTVLDDSCNIYPTEFINKLCPGGMSPHELVLKKNCQVILLRNLMPSMGLCNGTRLICKRFHPNVIECIILIGHLKGQHVFIPRIKLRPSTSTKYPFPFQRVQFPVKLSFAMTINKSQGQTLNKVAIYPPRQCFSAGQLYVALSRARRSSQVAVIAPLTLDNVYENSVTNIVSYNILERAGIR